MFILNMLNFIHVKETKIALVLHVNNQKKEIIRIVHLPS